MSLVTTLPAPIVHPRPMVTPERTITFPPSQQSSPMVMGAPFSGPFVPLRTLGSVGWLPEKKEQLGPISVRSPTVMGHVSIHVELLLMGNILNVVAIVHLYGSLTPNIVRQQILVFFWRGCLRRERCLVVHYAVLENFRVNMFGQLKSQRAKEQRDVLLLEQLDQGSSVDFSGAVELLKC
ncbi:hypothetical protein F5X97DRAFT_241354 [Nemania serpens]|nr:hypothetical protein F5X97DRAFT_241354 [Nemania serpens]